MANSKHTITSQSSTESSGSRMRLGWSSVFTQTFKVYGKRNYTGPTKTVNNQKIPFFQSSISERTTINGKLVNVILQNNQVILLSIKKNLANIDRIDVQLILTSTSIIQILLINLMPFKKHSHLGIQKIKVLLVLEISNLRKELLQDNRRDAHSQ